MRRAADEAWSSRNSYPAHAQLLIFVTCKLGCFEFLNGFFKAWHLKVITSAYYSYLVFGFWLSVMYLPFAAFSSSFVWSCGLTCSAMFFKAENFFENLNVLSGIQLLGQGTFKGFTLPDATPHGNTFDVSFTIFRSGQIGRAHV